MIKIIKLAFSPGPFHSILFSLLFLLISAGISAQSLTGTVLDADSKPINGATVTVKGTTNSTTTNSTGKFRINAAGSDVIVFSFVGFVTQEIPFNNKNFLSVSLIPGEGNMGEVIVTALGIKKESRKLGYAASTVNTEELVTNRTTNVMESLEGKVAGLNITPPSAGAGASTQIRLRGQVGFAGSTNSPLIVINGLPLDQDARNAEGIGQQRDRGDNLQVVNPDDIESMTILKGSTASALYGSRAAAGAIIITTKSG